MLEANDKEKLNKDDSLLNGKKKRGERDKGEKKMREKRE